MRKLSVCYFFDKIREYVVLTSIEVQDKHARCDCQNKMKRGVSMLESEINYLMYMFILSEMQNQLTSSFSLHIRPTTFEQTAAESAQPLEVKSEDLVQCYKGPLETTKLKKGKKPPKGQPVPQIEIPTPIAIPTQETDESFAPENTNNKRKKKKGKKQKLQPDPQIEIPKQESIASSVEDALVKKIMDILVKHKFQTQGPDEVAALVSNVRKIIAFGHVPLGSFNKELTQIITSVLLGKDPAMPALTDVLPTGTDLQAPRKRGRPRKDKQIYREEVIKEEIPKDQSENTGGRRKAAIAAEKQLSTINDSVIEIDCDDDWQADSDASVAEEIIPETTCEPPIIPETISKPTEPTIKKEKLAKNDTKQQLNSEISSILLSDDDEPPPSKQKTSKKTVNVKKENSDSVPLHPSLLSNKNFVKIVAHTYLEGNPMLDEDAATLAAQYSTQKALKEFESSGKPIFSGPIYDIAIQVNITLINLCTYI